LFVIDDDSGEGHRKQVSEFQGFRVSSFKVSKSGPGLYAILAASTPQDLAP
jgi:hypothetical protein